MNSFTLTPLGPQVDVRMMFRGGGDFADRADELDADGERSGPEVGAGPSSAEDRSPILDAPRVAELLR
ncbi:hypothetical protein [Actinospica sp.]|uniref:hypothetical protein n=1 Tax=Actinospica sp. TaxID=1872142 RepID=UPI002BE54054|nr:hypothetical protein [Actinospica sp.]HWG28477.1 hypothetical protein [Actinospica sp.]